jgi:hypothetical protein
MILFVEVTALLLTAVLAGAMVAEGLEVYHLFKGGK